MCVYLYLHIFTHIFTYIYTYIYICICKILFIYWLCWVFLGFALAATSGGHSLAVVCGSHTVLASLPLTAGLWGAWASVVEAWGLSSWGSRAQARSLWHLGLVVRWRLGSSQTRDRTCVSCIGRQILYHWATREAQSLVLMNVLLLYHFFFFWPELPCDMGPFTS